MSKIWWRSIITAVFRASYKTAQQMVFQKALAARSARRRAFAVAGSILFHLLFGWLLLQSLQSSLSSPGTTGMGARNGDDFAVTLVSSEDSKPDETKDLTSLSPEIPSVLTLAPGSTVALPVAFDKALSAIPSEKLLKKKVEETQADEASSNSTTTEGGAAAAGAAGENGQADDTLWGAIAPCWEQLAGKDTVAATLRVSFTSTGLLSAPPEIERDPSAAINTQTLQSEAKAIQALASCGAYPMAQGQENVEIKFPTPGPKPK